MSNATFLRGLYEAFGRGDVPTVLGAMNPDMEWREAEGHPFQPSGEAFRGPDAILKNVLMRLGADFDGFAVHPKHFHDAGDTVVVEGRYTGTHKSTGKKLDAQVCHVWRVRNGKLASFQQYTDTAQWQAAFGAR